MTRLFSLFMILSLGFCSCGTKPEKDFYEKISGMPFPKSAISVESIDNGEFVTTTFFSVDKDVLAKYIEEYKFQPTGQRFSLRLVGNSYLETANRLDDPSPEGFYYTAGTKGKNSWLYIADVKNNRFWAEVQYPDFSGD